MCRCSWCKEEFYDGQEMYKIADLTLCENCVNDSMEFYNADADEDYGVDDAVDEMRDRLNGW